MRKGILLACACVLCLSACGTGTKEQSKNPQKALEVGVETTPKSVEATSSPMVQKIKNTSGKRENPKDLKQIKLSVERWIRSKKIFLFRQSDLALAVVVFRNLVRIGSLFLIKKISKRFKRKIRRILWN